MLASTGINGAPFDVWTIPHAAAGFIARRADVDVITALWGALAVEAIEIALSDTYPNLARESRSNQLGDLAAFLAAYSLGGV